MSDFYESMAEHYDRIFPLDGARREFIASRASSVSKKPFAVVLDAGCATGEIALCLAERSARATGFDLDRAMIDIARRKARDRNLECPDAAVAVPGGDNSVETSTDAPDMFAADADAAASTDAPDVPGPAADSAVAGYPTGCAQFLVADLVEIGATFSGKRFDAILCLGNTLVHLPSPREIGKFMKDAFALLHAGGALIFQIVNYDRALDKRITELPLIDNDVLQFERFYDFDSDAPRIRFRTRLKLKYARLPGADARVSENSAGNATKNAEDAGALNESGARVVENETLLYPLRRNETDRLLREAGFTNIEHYGNYKGQPLDADSPGLIAVARK